MPALPHIKRAQAHATFRGLTLGSRGDIKEEPIRPTVDFTLAQTGKKQRLVSTIGYRVTIPVIATIAEMQPLLAFYAGTEIGATVGPHLFKVTAQDTSGDTLTIVAHPFETADAVFLLATEVLPVTTPQVVEGTAYYARDASADTITLHDTSGHATADTDKVDITTAGTGTIFVARQFPLTVHRSTGVLRTFANAIVEKFPRLVLNNGALVWEGDLVFRCLPDITATPNGTDSANFYTDSNSAYTPPSFSGSSVVSAGAITAAWGASAPWSSFRCENGFSVEFTPSWRETGDGVWPGSILQMTDFAVTAKGIPIGITKPQIDSLMNADLGALLTGSDLVFTIGAYTLTLKTAVVEPAATNYSPTAGLLSEVTWTAQGGSTMLPPFTFALT